MKYLFVYWMDNCFLLVSMVSVFYNMSLYFLLFLLILEVIQLIYFFYLICTETLLQIL